MNDQNSIDQVLIRKLIDIIHLNLSNENFGVNELASAAAMSRSTIHRKLKLYVNKSVSQFIREVRLQKAMEILKDNLATVSETSFQVGFSSPAYFNTCFHNYFGFAPGEIKKRGLDEGGELNLKVQKDEGLSGTSQTTSIMITGGKFINEHKTALKIILAILIFISVSLNLNILNVKKTVQLNGRHLIDQDKSIALLPFKNLSKNIENQYFISGIMDDIQVQLGKLKKLRIVSGTFAREFDGRNAKMIEIARKLNVSYILSGSVQREGDKIKVIVWLIDTRFSSNIWSEIFENKVHDNFSFQSFIAQKVSSELNRLLAIKASESNKFEQF